MVSGHATGESRHIACLKALLLQIQRPGMGPTFALPGMVILLLALFGCSHPIEILGKGDVRSAVWGPQLIAG